MLIDEYYSVPLCPPQIIHCPEIEPMSPVRRWQQTPQGIAHLFTLLWTMSIDSSPAEYPAKDVTVAHAQDFMVNDELQLFILKAFVPRLLNIQSSLSLTQYLKYV